MSLNTVNLLGNLTRDAELRYSQGGAAILSFGLAVNESWTGRDGQKQEKAHFIDCTMFGERAAKLAPYLEKGKKIIVEGSLDYQTWDDKGTGQKRSKIGVKVHRLHFLPRTASGSPSTGSGKHQPGDGPRCEHGHRERQCEVEDCEHSIPF